MWIALLLLACGQEPQVEDLPPVVQEAMAQDLDAAQGAGRQAYRTHCQDCHGMDAAGDGPASAALEDEPGDLAITSRDPDRIRRAIQYGIKGTAMPAHKLDAAELDGMVAWLASLPEPAE